MQRTYEIKPRADNLGGGWNLKLYEDGQEAGGGVFPIPEEDPQAGMTWWNAMTEDRRAHWLKMAASAVPVDARRAFLLVEAYNDAFDEAQAWAHP